jgi:hypothetical protein
MSENKNLSYPLHIRLTREEIDALACMAHDDLRDLKTQAYYSLRFMMIERGYLVYNPVSQIGDTDIRR